MKNSESVLCWFVWSQKSLVFLKEELLALNQNMSIFMIFYMCMKKKVIIQMNNSLYVLFGLGYICSLYKDQDPSLLSRNSAHIRDHIAHTQL